MSYFGRYFLSFFLLSSSCYANTEFESCKSSFKQQAKQAGFSSYIVDDVIEQLSPIERVIKLDKRQPEFSETFAHYVNVRVVPYRVEQGRKKLKKHQALLTSLEKEYGIPAQYLMSFWGLETNYGRHKGKMPVLNSIATLACDPRRSTYFTGELFALFTMIDNKQVTTEQLLGSWAGAMGHMQFMPSALKTYGLDADNSGSVDVWQSEVDALTSAANYLKQIGWVHNERWGRKVLLPADFDFSQVEYDRYYPLAYFKELGVMQSSGQPLSNYQIDAELFLPSGANGPAFLLYPNFNVIMKWNLSKNYALSVGLLADQIQGGAKVVFNEPEVKDKYSREQLKQFQQLLSEQGYLSGKADGIWGPMTRKAIRAFQLTHKLPADGYPSQQVLKAAGIEIKTASVKTVKASNNQQVQ